MTELALKTYFSVRSADGILTERLRSELGAADAQIESALDSLIEAGLVSEADGSFSVSPSEGSLILEFTYAGCSAVAFDLKNRLIFKRGFDGNDDLFDRFFQSVVDHCEELLSSSEIEHIASVSVIFHEDSPLGRLTHSPMIVRSMIVDAKRRICSAFNPYSVSFQTVDSVYSAAALKALPPCPRALYCCIRRYGTFVAQKKASSVTQPVRIRSAYGTDMKRVILSCENPRRMAEEIANALLNVILVVSPQRIVFDVDGITFPDVDTDEIAVSLEKDLGVEKEKIPEITRYFRDRSDLHRTAADTAVERIIRGITVKDREEVF